VLKLPAVLFSYRGLPGAIWTLFLTETVTAAGSFVYPFLALLLTRQYGMSEQRVGVFMGISAVACLLGTVFGGMLADAISRKHALIATMTVSAVSYAAVPAVSSVTVVSVLILFGIGTMAATKPAFDALVADLTRNDNRRVAFSLLYAAVNIGYAVGPLAASMLFERHVTWLFLGDAAATIIAAALIAILVPQQEPKPLPQERIGKSLDLGAPHGMREVWQTLRQHPAILTMLVVYTLNVALFSQIFFALPLYLNAHFGGSGATLYGVMMTVNAIAVVVMTPAITTATRRLSSGRCLALGGFLFALGLGGYGIATSMAVIVGLVFVWTMGELLNTTNARVFVADLAPPAQRGRLGAMVEFAYELGFGLGPVVAGFVIAHRGIDRLWPYLCAVGLATGLTMLFLEWHRQAATRQLLLDAK